MANAGDELRKDMAELFEDDELALLEDGGGEAEEARISAFGQTPIATIFPDRIFLQDAPDEITWCADRINNEDVEYIRADKLREGFTRQIWREAARFARRTAGQPTSALQAARDLIEEGR